MGSTSTLPDGPPNGVMHPTPLPQGPREASKAMLAGLLEKRIYFKRHFTLGFDVLGLLPTNIN